LHIIKHHHQDFRFKLWLKLIEQCSCRLYNDNVVWFVHRRLCRVKNMLAMYLKYHKAGLTPTTPVTSTAISPVKMAIGHKSLTNLRSEIIFLQGKPVFFISSYHLHPHTDR
jgi:hypothetical protein